MMVLRRHNVIVVFVDPDGLRSSGDGWRRKHVGGFQKFRYEK